MPAEARSGGGEGKEAMEARVVVGTGPTKHDRRAIRQLKTLARSRRLAHRTGGVFRWPDERNWAKFGAMALTGRWRKEAGARLAGSRPVDSSKVQAPGIVRLPGGGFRLFYTAVGPERPFPECQGSIFSALSADGLTFRPEPGFRIRPDPALPYLSRRALAPSVTPAGLGWRMYFEARGPAGMPTGIASAVSADLLRWELEPGLRIESPGGVGAPRYLPLPEGGGRMYFFDSEYGPGGPAGGERLSQSVVSASTSDGLNFTREPGYRMRDRQGDYDAVGITAAEVIPPVSEGVDWTMIFSAWQDVPAGTVVPAHPSHDLAAPARGETVDFAAASIATDLAGYRSRIFAAYSTDGLSWGPSRCIVEGEGYGAAGLDAVHAEDMTLAALGGGRYRMYYAACDCAGNFRIASAVMDGP